MARWATDGVELTDGSVLRLESFRLNGRLCTSKPAIIRFIAAQQGQPVDQAAAIPPVEPEAARPSSGVPRAAARKFHAAQTG